jgi:hypothetical protein
MPTAIFSSKQFRTPTVTINDPANFTGVDLIQIDPMYRGRPLFIEGDVGSGGPLSGLRVTWASTSGGTHTDLAVDSDFDTATMLFPYISAAPYNTAASGTFKLLMAAAPAELMFYAKGSGTTLTIGGSVG